MLSSSTFIPTRKQNPCVICGDTSAKCREGDVARLCMTFSDAIQNIPGFKFVGRTKNDLWGKWIEDTGQDWTEQQRLDWQREQQQLRAQREREEARRKAESMSAIERDRYYRQLLDQLTLHPDDRADLIRRGLTDEQIELGGFKSVAQWQRLEFELPHTLPGVGLDGRSLNIPSPGYLCPIHDTEGLITGFQLRLRDANTGGRYRWLTSATKKRPNGPTPHLPNGELPLAVHRSIEPSSVVGLVEGVGVKPFVASQRVGHTFIGAAGGLFAASPQTLLETFEVLQPSEVRFYPDAGAIANHQVLQQYRRAWNLLEEWGYRVIVAWWGQSTKERPDIDELIDLSTIRLLTVAQFEAIDQPESEPDPQEYDRFVQWEAKQQEAEEAEAKQQEQARKQRFLAETQRIQLELNNLRIEPTNQAEGRYIPQGLIHLPEKGGIILIDGSMGTGKTSVVLKALTDEHRRRYPLASRTLWVPRNLLGHQAAKVLGLPHHTTSQGFGSQLQEATLCFESASKIAPDRLPNHPPLLMVDEASQAFKQILGGKTTGQSQVFILNRMRDLFKAVIDRGGWIVLSEDNLSNLELDFVQQASGGEVVEFLKFSKSVTQPRTYEVYDSGSATTAELVERLQKGENLAIASDSQRWLRETAQLLENYVEPQSICVVDSESSEQPWVKDFSVNPQAWVLANRPRVLAWSPSVSSGVSIEDPTGHFSAMAFHLVHLEPREAKQLVDRLRSDVPRFGYAKERGTSDDELYSGSRPDLIVRDLHRNRAGVEKLTQFAEYASSKAPKDHQGHELDLLETMRAIEQQKDDPASDYGYWLRHWSRYKARENFNRLAIRDGLIEIWNQQGHNVRFLPLGRFGEYAEMRDAARAELDSEEAQAFVEADCSGLTVEAARDVFDQIGSTVDDRRAAKKRLLQDKLPGCPLDDYSFALKVIVEDNGKYLRQAERLWMTLNPEAAKQIDRWNWLGAFSRATRRGEIVWLPRLSTHSAQAKLLHDCPLEPFIKGEVLEWCDTTLEAIAVHQWALLHARQFRRYLRLTIKEEHSPVKTVNKLLKHLGLIPTETRRVGSRDNRVRFYAVSNLHDVEREQILESLTQRFIKRCEEKGESVAVSTTCSSITRIQVVDTASESCDPWLSPESIADIKSWLDRADLEEMLAEIRRIVPDYVWEVVAG